MTDRPPLLLYLGSAADSARTATGPALAAAAIAAGWRFECYYDAPRRGRHFAGDPDEARPGWPNGSLVAGGRHADHVRRLALHFDLCAVGDPASALWPVLDEAGAESLARTTDPPTLYESVFARLAIPIPRRALVVDPAPQGRHGVRVAPYLYPAFLADEPVLGVVASAGAEGRAELERIGVRAFDGLYVSDELDWVDERDGRVDDRDYAELTAELAERHAAWARGFLLGDPDLVAAELGRAAELRLAPIYGRPQSRVIAGVGAALAGAAEPVYGRQYDDHDFFELARFGRGLQVVDPPPPFEAGRGLGRKPEPAAPEEPSGAELEQWAREGRVLSTLLFWCGMVRELDCLPRVVDLVAETGLRAGLLATVSTFELDDSSLFLLGVPPDRGGVRGLLEPLLASTGHGVAAEGLLPAGVLADSLISAQRSALERLGDDHVPTGWWPLLDTPLVGSRPPRAAWRGGRPVVLFEARGSAAAADGDVSAAPGPSARSLAGSAVRRARLERLFEQRRPFDDARPGAVDPAVVEAVAAAGFSYMWTKSSFGDPAIVASHGDLVALALTAGNWDGWSPFYTVASERDLARAERRLLRSKRPGWLVGTIDTPLWALSGEALEHASRLYAMAALTARGGTSGRLVNVTPRVVARYARVLARLNVLAAR